MNTSAIHRNYSNIKLSLFLLPGCLLLLTFLFLYSQHALTAYSYIQIQKSCFLAINHSWAHHPLILINFTQLGDALIALSLVSVFIIYAPEVWECLLSASLVSMALSSTLKNMFTVPRPAVALDHHIFVITGKAAVGFASLPSGHSITVFTTLTVLLFAFMPATFTQRVVWITSLVIAGLMISLTRVGVGAHYPFDVIIGSIVGYISGITGIVLNRDFGFCTWISNKKYHKIVIMMIAAGFGLLVHKIFTEHLAIDYIAFIVLLIPFYKTVYATVKE